VYFTNAFGKWRTAGKLGSSLIIGALKVNHGC
jgi:hypothetical protein